MYRAIRNIHLLAASLALPFLLMYGVSALQMGHSSWFDMKPRVEDRDVALAPGQDGAREVARQLTERDSTVRGELTNVQSGPNGIAFRVVMPGTVHEVRYDPLSGNAHVRTSVAGFMGMLNRLHHAAGVGHGLVSLNVWGWGVAAVSVALLVLGVSGIYMWFTRRPERRIGFVLLAVNVAVALVLLGLIRTAGP